MTAPPPVAPSPSSLDDIRARLGDRYAIERELGRGGMGAVYLARDLTLDRPVALKVLPPEFASDASLRERFLRETRTAASFSHPNIVPVYAVEDRTGILAFAMGFVEGESLAQRIPRTGPLTTREMVRVLQDIGYALAYAHGRGVVHRDIKPDNIMIERATGRALLMDFGISRAIAAPVAAVGLTRVGEVVGTPEYMSPEQASGDVVDGRSDLYSLGLVAWFAATGETIMSGESTQKILVRQLTESVPPLGARRGDFPEALGSAIDRCTAKDPAHRFATAEELVDTIDAAQLAAPEIPLPIRLFAQELGMLSLVTIFLALLAWVSSIRLERLGSGDLFSLLPFVLFFAIGLTRYLQAFSEARRLAVMGFGADEVIAGLHRVLDEHDEVRAQLKNDPAIRKRRRSTIRLAIICLVLAVIGISFAFTTRIQSSAGSVVLPRLGLTILITAVILFGVGMVLLVKSPFRSPPNDRIFRKVWGGAFGRAFIRQAARGVKASSSAWSRSGLVPARGTVEREGAARASGARPTMPASTRAAATMPAENGFLHVAASPAAKSRPASAITHDADAVAELERRVRALERWRDGRDANS